MKHRARFLLIAAAFEVASLAGATHARAATGSPCTGGVGGGGAPLPFDDGGDDGGDDSGDGASDDGGVCAANEYCALPDGGVADGGAAGTCATQACGGANGVCAVNVYCGLPDAGPILDGAAGLCTLEPCVLASDCLDPSLPICDTSQTPFACVACISSNDCPGILICDLASHTCVNPPPLPDASAAEGGAPEAGGADASGDGGESAIQGDGASSLADANEDAPSSIPEGGGAATGQIDANGEPSPESGVDQGSLAGGAWDCDLGAEESGSLAAFALPLACAAFLALRRRGRRR
jgi:hypothetical protein